MVAAKNESLPNHTWNLELLETSQPQATEQGEKDGQQSESKATNQTNTHENREDANDFATNIKCNRPRNQRCLSTLDCDLKLNERCVQVDLEEQRFFQRLQRVSSNVLLFSPIISATSTAPIPSTASSSTATSNKIDAATQPSNPTTSAHITPPTRTWLDEMAEGVCGCSGPAFARHPRTGRCELLRPLQLGFKIRFENKEKDLTTTGAQQKTVSQLFLNALQTVVAGSDGLQESLHHYRLLNIRPIRKNDRKVQIERQNQRRKKRKVPFSHNRSVESEMGGSANSTDSTLTRATKMFTLPSYSPVYAASGLLMVYESQFSNDFSLQFSNQFCATLNQMQLYHRLQQLLSGGVMDEMLIHGQKLQSSSKATFKTNNQTLKSLLMRKRRFLDTKATINLISMLNASHLQTSDESELETDLNELNSLSTTQMLPDVNITKIRPHPDICALEREAILGAIGSTVPAFSGGQHRTRSQHTKHEMEFDRIEQRQQLRNRSESLETLTPELFRAKPEANLTNRERRLFSRLSYCEPLHAICQTRSSAPSGYVCTCRSGLMDLGAWPGRYPAEHCGMRCPLNYCSNGGFCHMRGSLQSPPEVTAQQQYLSTAARAASSSGGEDRSGLAAQFAATLLRYAQQQQRYFAAIYSVQQRFARLFAALPNGNINIDGTSAPVVTHDEQSQLEDNLDEKNWNHYRLPTASLYCTCSGWHIGARCQYSGLLVLCVLLVVVALLTFLLACAFSLLCVSTGGNNSIENQEKLLLRRESNGSIDSPRSDSPEATVGNIKETAQVSPSSVINHQPTSGNISTSVQPNGSTEQYRILPAVTVRQQSPFAAFRSKASPLAATNQRAATAATLVTTTSVSPPVHPIIKATNSMPATTSAPFTYASSLATRPMPTLQTAATESKQPAGDRVLAIKPKPIYATPKKVSIVFPPIVFPPPTTSTVANTAPKSPFTATSSLTTSPTEPPTAFADDDSSFSEQHSRPTNVEPTIVAATLKSPVVALPNRFLSQAQQTDSFDSLSGDRMPTRGIKSPTRNHAAQVQCGQPVTQPLERHFITISTDLNNNCLPGEKASFGASSVRYPVKADDSRSRSSLPFDMDRPISSSNHHQVYPLDVGALSNRQAEMKANHGRLLSLKRSSNACLVDPSAPEQTAIQQTHITWF